MKKHSSLLLLVAAASLLTAGCSTLATSSAPVNRTETVGNVTIHFQDLEHFTDCRYQYGGGTDEGYLQILADHIGETAARYLQDGQKLEVVVTDVDLAGDFLPMRASLDHVRIVKEIYRPRITLSFKLTAADGSVLKEGARTLADSFFMTNLSTLRRDEPLFYDKEMLSKWLRDEFKS
jgi:hypothetical protein